MTLGDGSPEVRSSRPACETVVILIVAIVQQLDAFARAEGVYYLFDFLFVAAFREVGHALHDS